MAKVHFIGAGQMTEAIIRASLSNGTLRADAISLEDIDSARIEALHSRYRLSGDGGLSEASLLVLGIRPQDDLAAVASRVRAQLNGSTTVVSLIAGVTLEKLASLFGETTPIARTIPNTLTDTGFGYSGVTLNAHASAAEIEPFLRGFGKVLYLPERLIDVFTGFGVAGPNYIYYFIESLTDAGVLAGLSRPQATEVVLENLLGAVGIHALYELNNSDFAAGLQRSVLAAVRRTRELGQR